jgi:hypothetical protein
LSRITLHVTDLDAAVAGFDALGIAREPIEHVTDNARKAVVLDPDGNQGAVHSRPGGVAGGEKSRDGLVAP